MGKEDLASVNREHRDAWTNIAGGSGDGGIWETEFRDGLGVGDKEERRKKSDF